MLVLFLGLGGGFAGYYLNDHMQYEEKYLDGYFDGQADLAYDLTTIIGLEVNNNNLNQENLKPIFDYHTHSFYVYRDGNAKTLVIDR